MVGQTSSRLSRLCITSATIEAVLQRIPGTFFLASSAMILGSGTTDARSEKLAIPLGIPW